MPRDIKERGRDLDQVLNQYMMFVKPAFEEFCSPTKKFADVSCNIYLQPLVINLESTKDNTILSKDKIIIRRFIFKSDSNLMYCAAESEPRVGHK